MDKKDAVIAMTKKGYHVTIEDRIPMFLLETSVHTPAQLKKALKEIGYHNSFGYKLVGKDSLPKESLSQDLDSEEMKVENGISEDELEDSAQSSGSDFTSELEQAKDPEQSSGSEPTGELEQTKTLDQEKEPEFYDEDEEDFGESSMWSDSDDFFESSDGQMSFF